MNTLIVIDVQHDFVDGVLGSDAAQACIPNIVKLIEQARASGDKIIFTQDTHNRDYLTTQEGKNLPVEHCIRGTEGWNILDECIAAAEGVPYSIKFKNTFGTFNWTGLDLCKEIHICGLASSICCIANAIILKTTYPEIPIIFHANASAGLSPENHAAAIEVMKSCQIKVVE